MGRSATRDDSLDIISLRTVKKLVGTNPMGLGDLWANCLDIIATNLVKEY